MPGRDAFSIWMLYFCFVFTELRQQPFLSNALGHQCSHDSPSPWNEWARSSLELLGLSRTFLPWQFPVFAGCFGTRHTNYMNRGFSSPVLPRYLLLGMQEKWSDATRERWSGGGVWAGAMLARKQGSRFRNKGSSWGGVVGDISSGKEQRMQFERGRGARV